MNCSLIVICSKYRKTALVALTILSAHLFIGRSIVSDQWSFLVAFVFFFLVWATYVSSIVGLGLVLGISLLAWTFRVQLPSWTVGPVFICSTDALTMVLSASVGLRWMIHRPRAVFRSPGWRLFFVFVVWMVLNIVLGLSAYAESAVGEARPFIYIVVVAIYVATYPLTRSQFLRIARLWTLVGTVIVGTALLRWENVLPMPIRAVMLPAISGSDWLQYRSIDAAETLFVLLMFLGLAILWVNRVPQTPTQGVWVKGGAIFLFFVILMMRHRSVWLAVLTGGAVMLFYFRSRMSAFVCTVLSVSLALGTTLSVWQPAIWHAACTGLCKSASIVWDFQGTTGSWRLEGWIYMLRSMSLHDYLYGSGFGAYFSRETSLGSVAWYISPHSFYVRTLSRLGVVGLFVYVAFVISLVRKLVGISGSTTDKLHRNMATVLFVGIMACHAFFVAYSPPVYFGILLGMAMWMTKEYAESEFI